MYKISKEKNNLIRKSKEWQVYVLGTAIMIICIAGIIITYIFLLTKF